MKGRRWNMEDAVSFHGAFRGRPDEEYWAVFDGHGGDRAAAVAKERHPQILAQLLNKLDEAPGGATDDAIKAAIVSSFVEASAEMTLDMIKRSGSTGVVVYVRGARCFVADVGDSRAVMWAAVSAQSACAIVASESNPVSAALKLRDFAYALGSSDNISCVVIPFHSS